MKSIQFNQFGTPDVLKLVETPIPKYSNNQLLIKVHAAGLNPISEAILAHQLLESGHVRGKIVIVM